MTPTAEQVLSAALELPDNERLELVDALLVSFEPTDLPPFDDAWRETIRRRADEIVSGSVTSISWADVKRHAREAAGD